MQNLPSLNTWCHNSDCLRLSASWVSFHLLSCVLIWLSQIPYSWAMPECENSFPFFFSHKEKLQKFAYVSHSFNCSQTTLIIFHSTFQVYLQKNCPFFFHTTSFFTNFLFCHSTTSPCSFRPIFSLFFFVHINFSTLWVVSLSFTSLRTYCHDLLPSLFSSHYSTKRNTHFDNHDGWICKGNI